MKLEKPPLEIIVQASNIIYCLLEGVGDSRTLQKEYNKLLELYPQYQIFTYSLRRR